MWGTSCAAQGVCVAGHARNSLRRSLCAAYGAEFFLYEKMGRRAIVLAESISEAGSTSEVGGGRKHPSPPPKRRESKGTSPLGRARDSVSRPCPLDFSACKCYSKANAMTGKAISKSAAYQRGARLLQACQPPGETLPPPERAAASGRTAPERRPLQRQTSCPAFCGEFGWNRGAPVRALHP